MGGTTNARDASGRWDARQGGAGIVGVGRIVDRFPAWETAALDRVSIGGEPP